MVAPLCSLHSGAMAKLVEEVIVEERSWPGHHGQVRVLLDPQGVRSQAEDLDNEDQQMMESPKKSLKMLLQDHRM